MEGRSIGHIRIVEALGEGGMGQVFVGFDEKLRRKVAVKSIHSDHRMTPSVKARFLREARLLSQLAHPNICGIHDYVEHEGGEYLVLELVDGVPLSERIAAGDLGDGERLDLAIQIAEALATAHGRGIVHRDLKPDNVMVTEDGQVKVLDFGLARVADQPTEEGGSEPIPPPESLMESTELSFASAFHTGLGNILGTPLYMSPEQARAGRVTTASDMYSFGLVLQTLFTGRSPYPADLGLPELIERVALADTLPVEGLGRDLTALIERLKSKAPAARATAIDVLERLRWIREAPRRRARRLGAAAVVVLAVLAVAKYTVDLRHERRIADQRRNQAEDQLEYLLFDLPDKLLEVGRLDVFDGVATQALEYFGAVPETELTLDELVRRSDALYQIGNVRLLQGDLAAASEVFEEALELCADLVERDPTRTDWLSTLGNCHFYVGSAQLERGELDEALAEFVAYRDVTRRLVELEPGRPEWRMEVAYGEGNVGRMLQERGDFEGAREALEKRLAVIEDLAASDPSREDWQEELALSYLQLGPVREALGDYRGALRDYEADLAIARRLADAAPQHAGRKEQLATSYSYIVTCLERVGEYARAEALHHEYLVAAGDLARLDPENTLWRRILGSARRSMARALVRRGEFDEAHDLARASMADFAALLAVDPERADWQRERELSRFELCRALGGRGESAAAVEELGRLDEELARLLAPGAGDDPVTVRTWSEAHLLRGELETARGRPEVARGAWDRARELVAPLARDSRDGFLVATYAVALARLGRETEAAELRARLAETGFVEPRLDAAVRD